MGLEERVGLRFFKTLSISLSIAGATYFLVKEDYISPAAGTIGLVASVMVFSYDTYSRMYRH